MIQNENIEKALEWRYATKQFDAHKKISEQDFKTIQNSILKAPSSYGLQPWRFFWIKNPDVRKQLREVSWGQSQVTDSSHYLVVAYKEQLDVPFIERHIKRVADVRGVPGENLKGYRDMMVTNLTQGERFKTIGAWAQRQTYIAMGFAMETAALLGIDSCPLEGLDPESYDKILKLEGTGFKTVAAVAFGYRSDKDQYQFNKKVRFDVEDVFTEI